MFWVYSKIYSGFEGRYWIETRDSLVEKHREYINFVPEVTKKNSLRSELILIHRNCKETVLFWLN